MDLLPRRMGASLRGRGSGKLFGELLLKNGDEGVILEEVESLIEDLAGHCLRLEVREALGYAIAVGGEG